MDLTEIEQFNAQFEAEAQLRDKIRDSINELDKKNRVVTSILNKIHYTPVSALLPVLEAARAILSDYQGPIAAIAEIVPPHQLLRYKDPWTNSLRTTVFSALLVEFLSSGRLASQREISELLGLKEEWKDRFSLLTEDYLHAILSLTNELSRLAVNSVTLGDFDQPLKISVFIKELFVGFSMLNLKNDTLRKRFDGLKYDMKKVEEVVYDISLRRLVKAPATV